MLVEVVACLREKNHLLITNDQLLITNDLKKAANYAAFFISFESAKFCLMNEELIQIGKQIRQRRESLNYTQNDVSEISGVAERTIRSIETGVNTNMANLLKVLTVLGLSLSVQIKQIEYGD